MTNLSELSKPVATFDVQRGRPDGNMFGVAWSSAGHALPDGPHFLYSQEYVSALIDENSAAKIAGVKEFAAEMIARADDSDNSLPDDVRDGMRRAAAFANMFIDLRGVQHG
ncbi:hypothetical protein [Serratia marcescens]|uniref:hypothetical protein n=1 Tax=Serratia marcescens TaxID=615 RepID=UPI00235F10D2|nr:hypothetical protein [Serratia marcescens]